MACADRGPPSGREDFTIPTSRPCPRECGLRELQEPGIGPARPVTARLPEAFWRVASAQGCAPAMRGEDRHGGSEERGFLIGSVSQALAGTDVLVVRPGAPLDRPRALLAVDGSRESLLGIESFARKTRADQADVRLLHALDLPPRTVWNVFSDEDDLDPQSLPEPLRRRVEHALCPALAALRAHGVEATTEVRRGRPAQEMLDAAVRHRADLIVMGARGLTSLRGLLVGSVTQRVVRYGATSVLVAR